METLSKDMLYSIAMKLELPELLKWCISDKKVLNKVCEDESVWRNKLEKDYPDYQKFNSENFSINSLSPKEKYVFLYQLTWIKKILKTNESEYDIFLRKKLDLSDKGLTKVPSFNLPNLQELFLSGNKLTEVPSFNLPNLKQLFLNNNNLTKVPSFNLPNLFSLNIRNNQLKEIPSFADLTGLRHLLLTNNNLTKFPQLNIPKMRKLYLDNNELTEVPSFTFPELLILHLENNKLTEIPSFNLPSLLALILDNNQLSEETKNKILQKYKNKVSV